MLCKVCIHIKLIMCIHVLTKITHRDYEVKKGTKVPKSQNNSSISLKVKKDYND